MKVQRVWTSEGRKHLRGLPQLGLSDRSEGSMAQRAAEGSEGSEVVSKIEV